MDNINDDLLTAILVRFPDCRQVARCATVCKRWSSLITTTGFARSFTDHQRRLGDTELSSPLALLIQRHRITYNIFPYLDGDGYKMVPVTRAGDCLSFLPWNDVAVRAYCDDLLLVSRVRNSKILFCICNPMTKKYCSDIPEIPLIATEVLKCALTCRRGGDNRGRYSYHVKLFYNCKFFGKTATIMDFSSETGRWGIPTMVQIPSRIPTNGPFLCGLTTMTAPVTCGDGLVYLVEGHYYFWEWVVAFDPSGHNDYKLVPPPAEAGENPTMSSMCLGAYRGRLRVAHITDDRLLRVWELTWSSDRREHRWSMVHSTALSTSIWRVHKPVLHPGNGNVVFLCCTGGDIWRYDMLRETSRCVGHLPPIAWRISSYPLFAAWPTPVP